MQLHAGPKMMLNKQEENPWRLLTEFWWIRFGVCQKAGYTMNNGCSMNVQTVF